MAEFNFEIEFRGKRNWSPGRKRTHLFLGIAQFMAGLLGFVVIFGKGESSSLAILFGGFLLMWGGISHALYGKNLLPESSYFRLSFEWIKFKNPSQKEKCLPREQLDDILFNKGCVEFVMADQTRFSYDLSILPEFKVEQLKSELEKRFKV